MRLRVILYTLIIFFFVIGTAVSAAVVKITIPAEVTVNKPVISLGDIAKIEGISGRELKRLSAVNLGKTPLPGYNRTISDKEIELLIEDAGFSTSEMKLNIPEQVIVKTASRKISADELLSKAKEYLLQKMGYPADRVDIEYRYSPPEVILPDRDYQLKFKESSAANNSGPLSLQVSIIIDNKLYRKVFLGLDVKVKEEVYIAKRNITVGEKLDREDFYQELKTVSNTSGNLILDFNNKLVKYGVTSIPISRGSVLTTKYLVIPEIVKAGDQLQAEIISGPITITTTVKARQSGKMGEYIMVENIETGFKFMAQIVSSNKVRLVQ